MLGSKTRTSPPGKPPGQRAGAGQMFPTKLHLMLSSAESQKFDHIVSWQPHGRCFKVHQPLRFVDEVMPKWFQHTKFASFRRQLNLYGFSRLTTGADYSGYYHENFLRGQLEACESMVRTRAKGRRKTDGRLKQPNFYEMTPCNADSRNDHLETLTCLPGNPQSGFNSFIDPSTSNTQNFDDLFVVSDHNRSDERTHNRF